jgi:hypothetical protein
MKKVLGLLFISSSIFSMQLDIIKKNCSRAKKIHQIVKRHSPKLNAVKQHTKSSSDDTKQCVESIYASQGLGDIKLYHDKNGFHVLHNNEMHHVKPCFMDEEIRNMTPRQVKAFQKIGYFSISQVDNRKFSLKFNERLRGGGPLFGGFMYWLTKSVCYGGIAAAAGTAVVTTGGAIVGAVAGGAVAGGAGTVTGLAIAGGYTTTAVTGVAAATTLGTTIVTTAGVGVGVASTAGVVAFGSGAVATAAGATAAGAVITKAAVVTTSAAIASGASVGGIIAGIEALSIAIGTFFGMLPTP